MAIGDYILCCKCEVKLIYDGDRNQREWWEERFGKEPEIECPNCKPQRTWVGLTKEQISEFNTWHDNREEEVGWVNPSEIVAYIDAKLKEKNT